MSETATDASSAPPATPSKTASIATDARHPFKIKLPDFTPKWSRDWVIPDNVLETDDVSADYQVTSTFPTDRPTASITTLQEWNTRPVSGITLPPLKLQGSKVVNVRTSAAPSCKFTLDNKIWDTFNQLNYHFDCQIDATTKRTTKPLKVKRWHVQNVDNSDSKPGQTNTIWDRYRQTEKGNFIHSFSDETDDVAFSWTFNASSTTFAQFGEKIKNTYSFLYTGHGAVMCKLCLAMYKCNSGAGVSDADYGTWTACSTSGCAGSPRSTHCIGGWKTKPTPSFMDGTDIANAVTVPTTPKYLAFSVCCGGAFEDSLFQAYIDRGTMHCIGFRKSTRCDWARDFEKSFLDTWSKTHKCDPAKISTIFSSLLATWQTKLQPVLFGTPPTTSANDQQDSDTAATSL